MNLSMPKCVCISLKSKDQLHNRNNTNTQLPLAQNYTDEHVISKMNFNLKKNCIECDANLSLINLITQL